MSKPTIIFIHGSWHNPSMYSPTLSKLKEAGYIVVAPKLPTVRNDYAAADSSEDVQVVRDCIWEALESGQNVMLVGHSYGGMICSQAPEGLLKKDRIADGFTNGVAHLYFIAAYIADEGQHIGDAAGGDTFDWVEFNDQGQTIPRKETVVERLYNDLPPAEGEAMAAQLVKHSAYAGGTPLTYAAWKHVRCTYLICTLDKANPVQTQEKMSSKLGKDCTIERLEAGHTPTSSRPDEVALSIRRAAGEPL